MPSKLLFPLERLLLTLWVGALWAIGYLAVPVLFASLDERLLAGMLAGKMFTLVSYLGLGCGTLLLLLSFIGDGLGQRGARILLLCLMLLLIVIGEFGIQPMMAVLKQQGLSPGSEQASQFAVLHGIASILYLLNSLCGLALVSLRRLNR